MRVYISQSFSSVVDVDAATVDEAIEKAGEIADFSLCHQCNEHMEPDGEAKALIVYDDQDRVIWEMESDD